MSPLRRFTCEEAFRRLDDFLDGELSATEMHLIQEHLEICEGCAREFTFENSVLRNVRARLRDVHMPPELSDRVRQLVALVLRDQEND
jgi:anti-sigma factor (TIGR02949 family)